MRNLRHLNVLFCKLDLVFLSPQNSKLFNKKNEHLKLHHLAFYSYRLCWSWPRFFLVQVRCLTYSQTIEPRPIILIQVRSKTMWRCDILLATQFVPVYIINNNLVTLYVLILLIDERNKICIIRGVHHIKKREFDLSKFIRELIVLNSFKVLQLQLRSWFKHLNLF